MQKYTKGAWVHMEPMFFVFYIFVFVLLPIFRPKMVGGMYFRERKYSIIDCLKILVVKVIFGFFVFMKSLVP